MDKVLVEWIDTSLASGIKPLEIAAAVGREIARQRNLPLDSSSPRLLSRGNSAAPRGIDYTLDLIGASYERSLDSSLRRHAGVHYTPFHVARNLSEIILSDTETGPICDPSVGGGAFLLAAAECLNEAGEDPERIVKDLLWGIDLDPGAIEVTSAALSLWASTTNWVIPSGTLVVADSLRSGKSAFKNSPELGFQIVIGNPPFQNQLQEQTVRPIELTQELRERWSVNAGAYADTAGYFLLVALSMLSRNGKLLLIQPQSILSTADAKPIREKLNTEASLCGMWIGGPEIFEAGVSVCAPLIVKGVVEEPIRIREGAEVIESEKTIKRTGNWAETISISQGIPSVHLSGKEMRSQVSATAGVRDQFYGLIGHVRESQETSSTMVPLVTVGMIDPFRNRWGKGQFRYAGSAWRYPMVNLETLGKGNPELFEWVKSRLRPKILVATQTKIVEVLPDPQGILVPSTPVISVECPSEDIWKIAAALSAPAVSASVFSEVAGAALSTDTIKLSATQIGSIPIPKNDDFWVLGATFAEKAFKATTEQLWRKSLTEMAENMGKAYAHESQELYEWWLNRLPKWR